MPEQPGSAEAVVPLAVAAAPGPAPATVLAALLDGPGWPWLAAALDGAAVGVAFWLSGGGPTGAVVALAALTVARRRERSLDAGALDDVRPLVSALAVAVLVAAALGEDGAAAGAWAASAVLVVLGHGALRHARRSLRRRGLAGRRTVIVGAGTVGHRLARRLEAHPEFGLRPVGFVDWPGVRGPLLGTPDELAEILARTGARQVALAFTGRPDADLLPVLRVCAERRVDVLAVPRLFDRGGDHREAIAGLPLVRLRVPGAGLGAKHAGDRAFAAAALFALAPLLLVIWAAVARTGDGPAVFRQRRVTRDGRSFDLLKFRTMSSARAEAVEVAPDPRLDRAPGGVGGTDRRTTVGRLLRRTSLDELPQLVNVVRGEMSLVGPRPERPEFATVFAAAIPRYEERHRMRAGLTGLAQVNGLRGPTSLTERVELDNFYIDHWSPALDVKILARTVLAVLRPAE